MGLLPLAPREDFPILGRQIEHRRIVYLDSAATTLKPRRVIDAVVKFYERHYANVHRGDHTLSREASAMLEEARDTVARFIGASAREIVFTHNTTDSLNLVAEGLRLGPDDNVVLNAGGHHSNILPWMSRCQPRFLPERMDGLFDLDALASLVDKKTRLIALGHVSNVTGAINPIADAVAFAREREIPVVVDAAQSVPHFPVRVGDIGCDFLAFSGHKVLGPSGVGVLYIREQATELLQPRRLGGGTPERVTTDGFILKGRPHRFEPGTPNIEGIVGLAAAIEYLNDLRMSRIAEHGVAMSRLLHERLLQLPTLRILGPADPADKIAIASIVPTKGALFDVSTLGQLLSDSHKVMVRSGTHCAHPYFASHGVSGSLRLSGYLYNGEEDIDIAVGALKDLLSR